MITEAKIQKAIDLLRRAERLALKYSDEGYYLAFSGGKDSQCIYHLAKMAGVKFKAHYNVTTLDPPELMRFIKKQYPEVEWHRPEKTFAQICVEKKILPTRQIRFCCATLKETGGAGMVVITGVRKAESVRRSKRNSVEIISKKNSRFSGTIDEFNRAYHTDDEGLQQQCINGKDKLVVNPIIEWTDSDVWSFIKNRLKIPYCELYDQGFHRIGCILCPMSKKRERQRELERYSNVRNLFLNIIRKIKAKRTQEINRKYLILKYPDETVLDWYISGLGARKYIKKNWENS